VSLQSERLNIVIINDYAHVQGGAAQVAIESARGLALAGHHVTFVYGSGDLSDRLQHENITLFELGQHDLLSNPSRLDAARKGIWNRMVEVKLSELFPQLPQATTIIHIHTWVKSLSISAVTAATKSGLPVVVTLHDYFSVCPNGGFYNYQTQQACTLKPLSGACLATHCDARSYPQKLWRYARQMVTTLGGMPKNIQHFIYVSEFSRQVLAPYLPSEAAYWHVPNPIDTQRRPPQVPSDSHTISYIGRLSKEKGADLFTAAASNCDFQTRLVGEGDLKSELITKLPNGEFTGWVDRTSVDHYIGTSRAIVFPSRCYETQGMVIAEAAAQGVPCIVSDACAGRDFVEHEVTGLWFRSGDAEGLAAAMQRLHDDPQLADKLGQEAYAQFWKSPPTIDQHIDTLTACYSQILHR